MKDFNKHQDLFIFLLKSYSKFAKTNQNLRHITFCVTGNSCQWENGAASLQHFVIDMRIIFEKHPGLLT